MFYSLRFSILMSMFAVAAVVILTVTIVAGTGTRAEFSRYVETGRELREERLQQVVVVWAENNQNPLMENLSALQYLTNSSPGVSLDETNLRFHALGTVEMLESLSADSAGDPGELIRFEAAPDGDVLIYQGQKQVGNFYMDPMNELELLPAQMNFMETVNWTLLVAAILAAGVAVTLTVILSRRVLHPVAALTQAARRMESGDLSQRVQVHSGGEIGELAHAFNAMAEALNRNEKLRRNMVTDIAHELRTPLTNIRGYLEALHDGMLEPEPETIDLIYDESLLLNRLIQDLQELAMAEAGQLHLEEQPLQISDVIEQAATMHQPAAAQKHVQLSAHLPAATARRLCRSASCRADSAEPASQCDSAHTSGGQGLSDSGCASGHDRNSCERHRARHRQRPFAVFVRALLSGGSVAQSCHRRSRTRSGDYPATGRGTRRRHSRRKFTRRRCNIFVYAAPLRPGSASCAERCRIMGLRLS